MNTRIIIVCGILTTCGHSLQCMKKEDKKPETLARIVSFDQWALFSKECVVQEIKKSIEKNITYFDEASLGLSYIGSWLGGNSGSFEEFGKSKGDELFAFLKRLKIPDSLSGYNSHGTLYIDGRKTPPILRTYFLTKTPKEEKIIYDWVKEAIQEEDELTTTQQHIFNSIIRFMFDHTTINKHISVNKESLELLKELKQNNVCCIFTGNMPRYAYDAIMAPTKESEKNELQRHCDEFRKIFDITAKDNRNEKTVFISGDMGYLTTHKELFTTIAQRHKVQPSQCVIVNDQEQNLAIPTSLKFPTICCKNPDQLRKNLCTWGVLKKK